MKLFESIIDHSNTPRTSCKRPFISKHNNACARHARIVHQTQRKKSLRLTNAEQQGGSSRCKVVENNRSRNSKMEREREKMVLAAFFFSTDRCLYMRGALKILPDKYKVRSICRVSVCVYQSLDYPTSISPSIFFFALIIVCLFFFIG